MRFEHSIVAAASTSLMLFCANELSGQATTRPFDGFTPGACYRVPRLVEHLATRDNPDTTAYNPSKDTTLSLARDSVRYCESIAGARVANARLLDESRVQLVIGEDSAAHVTMRRYMTALADSSIERRAWALHLIVDDNAQARPGRISAAVGAAAELDKLGPKGSPASVLAHATLADAERDRWSDSAATAEASRTIAKWKSLSPDDALKLADAVTTAFLIKAEVALRTSSGDAARAVIDTAMRMLPALAMGPRRQLDAIRRLYTVVGKKAEPIAATWWFNAEGSPARPAPGKVTIIIEASHACGGVCRPRYRALTRYADRFGQRGLELINFTKTVGFYGDTAPAPPAEEAKYDSTYFFGTRHIPGSLAVYETKFRWLPDGRRMNEPTPQDVHYPLASLVVVDRSGIIRYVAIGWNPVLEEPLGKLIDRLLSESTSPASQ